MTKNIEKNSKNSFMDYLRVGEVATYFFRKKDTERPSNFSLKVMHGINRISIIIFLLGVIFIILRRLM